MAVLLCTLLLVQLSSTSGHRLTLPVDEFADNLAASAAPEDRAMATELGRALGKSSFELRRILLLVNLDGCSDQGLHEILRIALATVMWRRALSRWRALREARELRVAEA